MKPLLKWVGGKQRLLPELRARMPREFGAYHEPFAGSAALFFELSPALARISDANPKLIGTYLEVRDHPQRVIDELFALTTRHANDAQSTYYQVRSEFNEDAHSPHWMRCPAHFIYLNKTCFNGLWRVNQSGEFNVPMGDYKSPRFPTADEIHEASRALANVALNCCTYQLAINLARTDDFVYLDPPYHPVSNTANFTSYTTGSFGPNDQVALAEQVKRLIERGVRVMASNSDTPFIRDLYAGLGVDSLRIHAISRSGGVNSDPSKRGRVNELIITGGYECDMQT